MYAALNALFNKSLTDNINIKVNYENLTNTDFYEQYLVNTIQFSAAKNLAEMEMLQTLIFDEKGVKRTYSQFIKAATPFVEQFNQYTRVEYEMCSRSAIMIEAWNEMYKDKDLYPYGIYRTRKDPRVRPEHRILEGLVFKLDDPVAQSIYPPNDWNCRCFWEQASEFTLQDYKLNPATSDQVNEALYGQTKIPLKTPGKFTMKDNVNPSFRNNVAIDGMVLPNKHSYFKDINSANDLNGSDFKLSSFLRYKLNRRIYSDYLVKLAYKAWEDEKPSNKGTNIVFQNKEWLLNVFLTQTKANELGKTKGFENIKRTIERPSEIWGRWDNPKKQKETKLTYLSVDTDLVYFVDTFNGSIENSGLIGLRDLNKKRKGVKFIK